MRERGLDLAQYRRLAAFRYELRCFLAFSEQEAVQSGLTPRQHQALLAIKGAPEAMVPTIGYLAERLGIQPHSAVELANRLAEAGLAERRPDAADRRRVRLVLTAAAEEILANLSAGHVAELARLRPVLLEILDHATPGR